MLKCLKHNISCRPKDVTVLAGWVPHVFFAMLKYLIQDDESILSQDKEQGKNIVVVGSWNAEEHLQWAQKNVARSYQFKDDGVQKVKYVRQLYNTFKKKMYFTDQHYVTEYWGIRGWCPGQRLSSMENIN